MLAIQYNFSQVLIVFCSFLHSLGEDAVMEEETTIPPKSPSPTNDGSPHPMRRLAMAGGLAYATSNPNVSDSEGTSFNRHNRERTSLRVCLKEYSGTNLITINNTSLIRTHGADVPMVSTIEMFHCNSHFIHAYPTRNIDSVLLQTTVPIIF